MSERPSQISQLADAGELSRHAVHLAIGMFDGMHLGHRSVLEAAVQSARRSGGLAAMLTFWPHPSAIFRPESPTRLIQPMDLKIEMAGEWGVQWVATQPFDPAFAALAAEDFLPWLRRHLPRLEGVYVGENFRFGQGRKGDVTMLVGAGKRDGVTIFSAPRVNVNGEPVSSTRIRGLLAEGKMAEAAQLLGYTYFSRGTITPGRKLGRTIGFPTLNLEWNPPLTPRYGVYAVKVFSSNSEVALPGVANYGLRPTVENTTVPRLETHLLGEAGELGAGSFVRIEWCEFLRPEIKFGGLPQLQEQIGRDRQSAAGYFAGKEI